MCLPLATTQFSVEIGHGVLGPLLKMSCRDLMVFGLMGKWPVITFLPYSGTS